MSFEALIGDIMIVPFGFVPRGWLPCDGRLLELNRNTALFALLGTTYGGNGTTNFALPDLRGRIPVGLGQGAGLGNYMLGQRGGSETETLNTSQLPMHAHTLMASSSNGTQASSKGNLVASPTRNLFAPANEANTALSGETIGATGAGQPHENRQPYLCIYFYMAIAGIYPSQS